MKYLDHDIVLQLLLRIWGKQACRRPEDRPLVLDKLLNPGVSSRAGEPGRGSLAPLANAAVAQLAKEFGNEAVPADPTLAVWRAFPRLDRAHCTELANLLIELRHTLTGQLREAAE